ncbi:MAG TPA: AarF/ABC1/UbiB kinase family protein [Haliangiales bacterium]|nr:AarF/ABC1/UbiB kinase family protein [Haliangiales bacterium]
MVAIVSTVRDVGRLGEITATFVRHGFGELCARAGLPIGTARSEDGAKVTFAARLRMALQELGPSFIKLGQIVSTRTDLIPADVCAELKKLQDGVPPISDADVHATIQETLGAPAEEVFRSFEPRPLACASIGQVHRAVLAAADGGADVAVVVKIQRPGIRETIERDIALLHFLARLLERAVPESRVYSPVGLVSEFDRAIFAELDFALEADNVDRFRANFAESAIVTFPEVYRHASGKKVLTMQFLDGKKVYAAIDAGASAETIAKNALAAIAQMVFEDGFFHADPHPGNVLVMGTERPVIGLIDLGLVGRLSAELRDRLIDLMVAAVRAEPDALADALLAIGRPRGKVDQRAFRAEVATLSEKYLGRALAEIEVSGLLRDLVQGAIKYDIDMPSELLMVGKALVTVEGVGKEIYPQLDVFSELKPFFLKLLWRRYHPERVGRELLRGLAALGTTATNLPRQMGVILEDLANGRLEVKTQDPGLPIAADRLGRRVGSAIVLGAFALSGAHLMASGNATVGTAAFVASGVLAACMLLAHLFGDARRKGRP